MGTTQKGIISRAIGVLFAAGVMGQNGGHFTPAGLNAFAHTSGHKHGSSKHNNKTPRKPSYSLVRTLGDSGMAEFRNRSTGATEVKAYKTI